MSIFCVQCGIQLPAAARFCPRCGSPAAIVPPSIPRPSFEGNPQLQGEPEISRAYPPSHPTAPGVGGWLVVLAAMLLVVIPFLLLAISTGYVNGQQAARPDFTTIIGWNNAWLAMWAINIPLAIWSIEAGRRLLTKWRPPTIRFVKLALWLIVPLSAILSLIAITLLAQYSDVLLYMAFIALFVSVGNAIAWRFCLADPQRVPWAFVEYPKDQPNSKAELSVWAAYLLLAVLAGTALWLTRFQESAWMVRVPGDWQQMQYTNDFYDVSTVEYAGQGHTVVTVAETFGASVSIRRFDLDCSNGSVRTLSQVYDIGPIFASSREPFDFDSWATYLGLPAQVC